MQSVQAVFRELADGSGFKKYFKGDFGRNAKRAEAVWRDADIKGVCEVTPVADFSESGVSKVIYAFTIDGSAIIDDALELLTSRAAALTPAQTDAEDRNWLRGFEPLLPPAGHPANKRGDAPFLVYRLAEGLPNIRTFLHTSLFFDAKDRSKTAAAYTLYARAGESESIALLERIQV